MEIGQLAAIMNKEYGDEDQKFEYQLVRITKKGNEEIEERYEVPASEGDAQSLAQPEQVLSQAQLDQIKQSAADAYKKKMEELEKMEDDKEE
jgi:hypothetical protein